MGTVLSLEDYLKRIKYPENITLLQDFKGQNTKAQYTFKRCNCEMRNSLKQISLLKNFENCRKCRPRYPLEHYLKKTQCKIKLLEEYIGGNTRCSFIKSCGHEHETILNRLEHINIGKCINCIRNKPLKEYVKSLPEKIANSVHVLDKYIGIKSDVQFTYLCGHSAIKTLSAVLEIKHFDNCNKCLLKQTEELLIKQVPEKYRDLIEFETNSGFDSVIVYKNPCGCSSKTVLGDFIKRKQFDYCLSCYNSSTKLSSSYYLNKLNISATVLKENGRFSYVRFNCPSCYQESDIQIHSLLATGAKTCRNCSPYNLHSDQDMVDALAEFITVDGLSDRCSDKYSGSRDVVVHGFCNSCSAKIKSDFFTLKRYYAVHEKQQCKNCAPKNIIQKHLYDFVISIDDSTISDTREIIKFKTGRAKEIDIYCPNKKFAIEYNGLIWHSEKYKNDKYYHWKKTEACKEKGITLLHIWSDRYHDKKHIYESIIKLKLGRVNTRVFARKTVIKELSKSELKSFFDKNHLDGHVGCMTGWGLFYNDELVQAVSVRKVNSQNKKYKGYLEVARSATLINHLVVGGESKLLSQVESFARDGFDGILNYVSCDFGGVPKKKWKFQCQGVTGLSYFYTDGSRRVPRQALQKRKPGQTEKELASEKKLYRVFGTPNLIYTLKF